MREPDRDMVAQIFMENKFGESNVGKSFLKPEYEDFELPTRTHVSTIALAQFVYRLADCLEYLGETDGRKLKSIALSKSIKFLRNAGGLCNKIHIR